MIVLLSALAQRVEQLPYHLAARALRFSFGKEALPRYKPCGGGVSPAIGQWFDFDFSPAISVGRNTIRYTWKMATPEELKHHHSHVDGATRHFLINKRRSRG